MSVRILIVDDHEVVREGVRTIINRAKRDWEICGEASNGQEAIAAAAQLKPDIILLDITMPVLSGLDAASRIAGLDVTGQILIFTMNESDELPHDARRDGARGYVTKSDAARHSSSPLTRSCPGEHSSVGQKNRKTLTKTQVQGFYFDSAWLSSDTAYACHLSRLTRKLTRTVASRIE